MTVTNDCRLYVSCVTQTVARNGRGVDLWSRAQVLLGPVYMEWGTPVWWGWFLLFSRSGRHKTKETYPTRPGSPTPCKQGLSMCRARGGWVGVPIPELVQVNFATLCTRLNSPNPPLS